MADRDRSRSPRSRHREDCGHDETWASPEDVERFKCPICCLVARDALSHHCGSSLFCETCWTQWMARDNRCPSCREDSSTVVPAHFERRTIKNLQIKCPNGCDHTMALVDKASHVAECPHRRVTCESCGSRCKAFELAAHEETCRGRLEPCCVCEEPVYEADLPQHFANNPGHVLSLVSEVRRLRLNVAQLRNELQQRETSSDEENEPPPPPPRNPNPDPVPGRQGAMGLPPVPPANAHVPNVVPPRQGAGAVPPLPRPPLPAFPGGHNAHRWQALPLLATGADDKCICIWDTASGTMLHKFHAHRDILFSICSLSRDTIASAGSDMIVKIWDVSRARCMLELPSDRSVRSICKLNAGMLATAEGSAIKVWSLETRHFLQLRALGDFYDTVRRLTPRTFATSGNNGIHIWDLVTGVSVRHIPIGPCPSFRVLSPTTLVVARGRSAQLWDISTGLMIKELIGHDHDLTSVCGILPNVVASGSKDHTAKLWNWPDANCIKTLTGHNGTVYSLCTLSPRTIATCSQDTTVKVWDVNTGLCMKTLNGHTNVVRCVCRLEEPPLL